MIYMFRSSCRLKFYGLDGLDDSYFKNCNLNNGMISKGLVGLEIEYIAALIEVLITKKIANSVIFGSLAMGKPM